MRPFTLFLAALFTLSVEVFASPPVRADTFTVVGLVEDGYVGPATGVRVTLCEYDVAATGYSETLVVPDSGIVQVSFPLLPPAVAFEVEADKLFEDVHLVVAQPSCPVSPCNPTQSGVFTVRLERRPRLPKPAETFRPYAP